MLIQKLKESLNRQTNPLKTQTGGELTILAKSNKHTGFCVAAVNKNGKIIRLVRDKEGHALFEESCRDFNKLDRITARITSAPLKNQRENFILEEVSNVCGTAKDDEFDNVLTNSMFIFGSVEPSLTKKGNEKASIDICVR